jgi:hypothetical protein
MVAETVIDPVFLRPINRIAEERPNWCKGEGTGNPMAEAPAVQTV